MTVAIGKRTMVPTSELDRISTPKPKENGPRVKRYSLKDELAKLDED